MMSDLNKVIITGRLTRDPELKTLSSGVGVADFSLAVNRTYTSNDERVEEVNFIDCTAWGKTCDFICNYFQKGKPMIAEGRLKHDTWETEEGQKRSKLSVVVERANFVPTDSTRNGNGGDVDTDFEAPF